MGSTTNLECQKLLLSLKMTVEGLLVHQVTNVWDIYGGLNRLHSSILSIFQHGCRNTNKEREADIWGFIQGLNWLQPSLSVCESLEAADAKHLPNSIHRSKAYYWLYKAIEKHSLSEKLSWLISDAEHLKSCYGENAFLRQPGYAEATIVCLKAVEQNQAVLLNELDPSLYVVDLNYNNFQKYHRRCSSLPEDKCKFFQHFNRNFQLSEKDLEMPVFSSSLEKQVIGHVVTGLDCIHGSIPKYGDCEKLMAMSPEMRRSSSLPNLNDGLLVTSRLRSKTLASRLSPSILRVNYSAVSKKCEKSKRESKLSLKSECPSQKSVKLKKHRVVRRDEGEKEWFVVQGKKEERKKTFMEDGGTSVLPMSTGYFPRPTQGQSLTSFLMSENFSKTSAELDRENAHFSISEAMIAAIEQIKCNRELRLVEDVNEDDSDEEINSLKQRIRLRRRQRIEEKQKHFWSANLLSDGKTDTTTTDQSVSPFSTSPETPSDSISTDDIEDFDVDEAENLKQLKDSGLSVSMASLYSEADLSRQRREGTESVVSAENVALSLLRQFKEKQLPRASDLEWLVSKEDAPQELLPLPKSWPISPDDADLSPGTSLRGTSDWAPPRAQVIFTVHPGPVRRVALGKQNSRCAGCGLRVAPEYAHKFRYCEYLGRYFCTGCHSNQLSVIPGRILTKWDFSRYAVSTFSYRLLDQMMTDPLFALNDHNPSLYKKVKQLEKSRQLRLQLYCLKDFILTCRFAQGVREELEREPSYILTDPDMYSLYDLIQVKSGEFVIKLRELVKESSAHVDSCEFCQARGFVCELCPSKGVIFPWEISKVHRCCKCGACFHLQCFKKSGTCPRCARVSARQSNRDA